MFRILGLALVALTLPSAVKAQLVIAGGGLEADTQLVWDAFINRARPDGPVVIVPSASGSPAQSGESVRATMVRYGMDDDRIMIAPLALMDDRGTDEIDESTWSTNADDADLAKTIEGASAIWFTGGDQSRTTTMLQPDGVESPVLSAIRTAYASGAPIGGTSAGAAIMSRAMILQGDSFGALTGSETAESLELGMGLGFLRTGLVDQHFGERARLGRLAVAIMAETDPEARIGYGIDENTALIVNPDGTATVEGTGYVTILDGRAASLSTRDGRTAITGLVVHMASEGDRMSLTDHLIASADWKTETVGREYRRAALPAGGGMAIPGQALQDVIGDGLVDNAESDRVERVSFDGSGQGFVYRFTQSDTSTGHWGRGPSGRGRYTIGHVGFHILPVDVSVSEVGP